MIVLAVGMPRAGSGWHYNLIHDLKRTTGCADAREIRSRYHLEKILTEVNCNIGVLSLRRLAMVTGPALSNTFVIKAHSGVTLWARALMKGGLLRVAYIYRDPRDAMLSAFDYGQRAIAKGRPNAFSHLTDFEKTLNFMAEYVDVWEGWIKTPETLVSRYEDLLTNYDHESGRLIRFLGVDPNADNVKTVLDQYRPDKVEGQQGTHFYKGKIGRFREVYSPEQQKIMIERFGSALTKMGYAL